MTMVETRRHAALGTAGGLMIAASLVYLVVEAVVASAWRDPRYSYLDNLVPSLGATTCGELNGQLVCSPLNPLMNVMFVVHGALFAAAAILLSPALRGRVRGLLIGSSILYAVGLSAITVFHHYEGMPVVVRVLNITGAFVGIFAGGAIAIIVGLRREAFGLPAWMTGVSVVLGAVGIVAGIAFFALSIGPLGVRERVSIYPLLLWQLLAGASLIRARMSSRTAI